MGYLEPFDQQTHGGGTSVLVADDDADIRGILGSLLQEAGYLVMVAADGNEALALCRLQTAALVLLDMAMPNGNGLETCEILRRMPGWAAVPIAMLTGFGSIDVVQAAARAGATGFIVKPFTPVDLLRRVAGWTGRALPEKRSDPVAWKRTTAIAQRRPWQPAPGVSWAASHAAAVAADSTRIRP